MEEKDINNTEKNEINETTSVDYSITGDGVGHKKAADILSNQKIQDQLKIKLTK